jgi:integrase/recombinase XerD
MSALRRSLDDYLSIRRGLGFKLAGEGRLLADFARFADQAGVHTLTVELALAWATLPPDGSPLWLARRLRAVRGFARYLQTLDQSTEIPPAELLPARASRGRATPYLYSDADIVALMAAARRLAPPLRAATFETLIGLLAVTGLRIGEAMRLDRDDVDWVNRLLTVGDSKYGKSREVLLHQTTVDALRSYNERRDRLCSRPQAPSFFISTRGTRLVHSSIYPTFRTLLGQAGLAQRSSSRRPRVHDLRHSFAVSTLLGWYGDGGDVPARMPLLSTFLGHVDPAATYWYLSATPELLALAAMRLELAAGEQS